ncbi:hypothetical protein ACOMHN_043007 [Nucella lapillus]
MASTSTVTKRGACYCCVINCSNNNRTSIDPRIGKPVRFFYFPNPETDRERCQNWIINIRRDDVKIADIKSKRVCSAHFHEKVFNCPTDIQHSRLLPTAVPTIVSCPNPPPSMECRRPPPKIREPVPKRRRQDTDDAPASSSVYHEGDGDDCDGDRDSTRPVVKASEPDPEKLAGELKQAKRALEDLKKQNKQLERKCKTAQSAKVRLIERHAVQVASLRAKKKAILENFLKDLPVVPAALFKIMMRKKKWINWDTEKEAMELCLAVYFRSTSAYAVLRYVGFQLPHPRTLRRRFSTVLTGVGLCQSLFEMMHLRTLALEEHEKRVTLSLDGMTVTKALTYSHHRDELVGFVNCGEHHQSDEIANQAILVMIRGLTLKWKQVLGYFVAKHNQATPTLTAIISEIVRTVTGIGLYVDAIVMDQESCQWKSMKDIAVGTKVVYCAQYSCGN